MLLYLAMEHGRHPQPYAPPFTVYYDSTSYKYILCKIKLRPSALFEQHEQIDSKTKSCNGKLLVMGAH